ncbi:Gfo/Idh/MocA family protein [Agromyces luteolus]|uniref:Gfo/Idh/MocA family oxidoreductase n=2 Tax=Agromyces luteolus TaxID=88373 RepID=A0A7C9LIM9_9MICO|nr:Gfo/Idh/MocA family oxidoreductase [Agromyces luteolus]MUN08635.1 gfo/Idh/MocA family oxidoreductase [Agromyces luteolus]
MPSTLPRPRPWPTAARLRWGIVAPGGIAARFVRALAARTDHRVMAIGSRSAERARGFAHEHGVPRAYGSYDELVVDPEVDAVYIASPHSVHAEQALLAIAAGKHVLVEKPFTTTPADAARVFAAARDRGVLAMEAMWTRYLPQADSLRQLLEDGTLGDVTMVSADFGFSIPFMPAHRLFDPALAGGALFDAGVYPVSFISSVLGAPTSVSAIGSLADSGVDDQAIVSLGYPRAVAIAQTSLKSWSPVVATVCGTRGRLEIGPEFLRPTALRLTLVAPGSGATTAHWEDQEFADEPYEALACEASAFAFFVEQGLLESPVHPHAEVVSIIDILERAQKQIISSDVARNAGD